MPKSAKSAAKVRRAPYVLNPLPTQVKNVTAEWRRNNALSMETEIVKPESFLPVTTGASGRSPVCFTIKSIPHSHIDGRNIFIETRFCVEKYASSKWVPITVKDEVVPIANTYCSIFEDLNVSINGVIAENSQRDHAIRSYLQNLLFTTEQDRKTWLVSGLQALDGANMFHQVLKPEGDAGSILGPISDPGQYARRKATASKESVLVYGKLLSDVLNCSEPLPDNVTINVKLFPAKSEACLVQNLKVASTGAAEEPTQYRIKISDCSLYVPRITCKESKHIDRHFTYTNWRVLAYTHQKGQSNFKKDIAIGDTLPQKAIVVFMEEKTYNGDWGTSKVAFEQAGVASVLMKCNHKHVPFINGYQVDWKNDFYHTAYVGLTTELGAVTHAIDYNAFDDGYSIYGFDLTPNKTGDISLNTPLRGALELDVEFSPPQNKNLMAVVLLIYADKFSISKAGSFTQN